MLQVAIKTGTEVNVFEDIRNMNGSNVDHIISLGVACDVAFNLRRNFDFGSSYPFDWWISPDHTICKLLTDFDVDDFYNPNNLELTDNVVVNTKYGVKLYHEFEKKEGIVSPDFRLHIEKPKSRTSYLWDRLKSLNTTGKKIVFFRRQDSGDAAELKEALDLVFDKVCFSLVVAKSAGQNEYDQPIRTVHVGKGPDWMGDQALWKTELQKLNITLDNPSLKKFDWGDLHGI